tara:strand:+ start:278 stop:430 length:153 start_codon:yes stop_codon:yes gene_type:complete
VFYECIIAKCFLDDGKDSAAEIVTMKLALDIPMFPNEDFKLWKPKNKSNT